MPAAMSACGWRAAGEHRPQPQRSSRPARPARGAPTTRPSASSGGATKRQQRAMRAPARSARGRRSVEGCGAAAPASVPGTSTRMPRGEISPACDWLAPGHHLVEQTEAMQRAVRVGNQKPSPQTFVARKACWSISTTSSPPRASSVLPRCRPGQRRRRARRSGRQLVDGEVHARTTSARCRCAPARSRAGAAWCPRRRAPRSLPLAAGGERRGGRHDDGEGIGAQRLADRRRRARLAEQPQPARHKGAGRPRCRAIRRRR